jgi:calcineurin-like phosphoesterase family protein
MNVITKSETPLFCSDFHFEHKNIVRFTERPWLQEQNTDKLIERWNDRVGLVDDVYHLGDFAFIYPKQLDRLISIIKELNGNIHFIRGNHCDKRTWQLLEDSGTIQMEWVKDYHELKVQGQNVILCHYPMEVWNGSHHGSFMLHGHCHGSLAPRGKRLDVGIDNHPDHQVWTWQEICEHMAKQQVAVMDHHDGSRA